MRPCWAAYAAAAARVRTPSDDVLAMVEQLSADRHVAITVQQPFTGFQRLPKV